MKIDGLRLLWVLNVIWCAGWEVWEATRGHWVFMTLFAVPLVFNAFGAAGGFTWLFHRRNERLVRRYIAELESTKEPW